MTDRDPPKVPGAPGGDEQSEFVMRWGAGGGAPGPKGAKGEPGEQGPRGVRGLPRGQARTIIYLFTINLLFAAACFGAWLYNIHVQNQERCASLQQIVAIPVPHPTAGNPSRMWESRYEEIQRTRGRQLGCWP